MMILHLIDLHDFYDFFTSSPMQPVVSLKQNSGRSPAFIVITQKPYLKVSRIYELYVTCKNI